MLCMIVKKFLLIDIVIREGVSSKVENMNEKMFHMNFINHI